MALKLQEEELTKLKKQKEEEEIKSSKVMMPSIEQDKQAMDDILGFLDDWDKEEKEAMGVEDFEDLESTTIVSIPESILTGLPKYNNSISAQKEEAKEVRKEEETQFKIYEDEVPPIPLDDYTPIDVEDQSSQKVESPPVEYKEVSNLNQSKELSTPEELPSFEELKPPDFDSAATEYDTEFVLEEESGALDSVLKDLGWEEEE
jgi:hypothetical protein